MHEYHDDMYDYDGLKRSEEEFKARVEMRKKEEEKAKLEFKEKLDISNEIF